MKIKQFVSLLIVSVFTTTVLAKGFSFRPSVRPSITTPRPAPKPAAAPTPKPAPTNTVTNTKVIEKKSSGTELLGAAAAGAVVGGTAGYLLTSPGKPAEQPTSSTQNPTVRCLKASNQVDTSGKMLPPACLVSSKRVSHDEYIKSYGYTRIIRYIDDAQYYIMEVGK